VRVTHDRTLFTRQRFLYPNAQSSVGYVNYMEQRYHKRVFLASECGKPVLTEATEAERFIPGLQLLVQLGRSTPRVCHPERSEGSQLQKREQMLRSAQHDMNIRWGISADVY
jgi:hypothetical protein